MKEIKELADKIKIIGTLKDGTMFVQFDIKSSPEVTLKVSDDSKGGLFRPQRWNIFKKAVIYWLYHKIFNH